MTRFFWLLLCGGIFGVANIIPGVSGGTMAVVLDVYDDLVNAIGNFAKDWRKSLRFLIPFGLGAGAALIIFAGIVSFLLEKYPMPVNFFFLGLIIGSVPLIGKRAAKNGFRLSSVLSFLAAAGLMAVLFFVDVNDGGQVIRTLTIGNFFLFLVSGFIASVAMIIPGISGSMMLVIFGVYTSVLGAISDWNFPILLPAAAGILAGLLFGSKLIAVFLQKFPVATYSAILGLIIGSVFHVFAGAGFRFSMEGLVAVALLLAGGLISWLMTRERPPVERKE